MTIYIITYSRVGFTNSEKMGKTEALKFAAYLLKEGYVVTIKKHEAV